MTITRDGCARGMALFTLAFLALLALAVTFVYVGDDLLTMLTDGQLSRQEAAREHERQQRIKDAKAESEIAEIQSLQSLSVFAQGSWLFLKGGVAFVLLTASCSLVIASFRMALGWTQSTKSGWLVLQKRAERQPVPDNLTYSPSHAPKITYSIKNQIEGSQPQLDALPLEVKVPDFGQLLAQGLVGADLGGVLLGFDEEQKPIKKSFARLGSVLISGMSNMGKTVTISSFVSQLALQECELIVADPHGGGGKPDCLRNRLSPFESIYAKPVAIKSDEISNQAKWIHQELVQRREEGKQGKRMAWVIDELSAVLRTEAKEDVKKTLCALAQEGRGFGMYAFAICHHPKSSSISTEVRDSFPINVIHRLKRKTANLLGVTAEEAELVSKLPIGHYWLDDGRQQVVLGVPLVNDQHVQAVANALNAPSSPFEPPSTPLLTTKSEKKMEGATEGAMSETEKAVLKALKDGVSQSTIIKQVFGTKGGSKYQKAAQEISAIIARHL